MLKKICLTLTFALLSVAAVFIVGCHKHSYAPSLTVAPTCSEQGYTLYTCDCGKKYKDDFTEKTEHTPVTDQAVAPTCTSTGLTEGSHCGVCSAVIVEQQTVKKTEHTPVIDQAVAPTCTSTGLTEGSHCGICGAVIVEQQTVKKTEHTPVVDQAVAPTCTSTGLTEGSHCGVCSAVIVEQQTVKKTEHTPVTDQAVAPTCISTGLTEGSHCGKCGCSVVVQSVIEKTAHNYGSAHVVLRATCTEDGIKNYECTVCRGIISSPIPAHGHRYSYAESGEQAGVCAECNSRIRLIPRDGNSVYGYYDFFFKSDGAQLQTLYNRIYTICESFADSEEDVASDADGDYLIDYASLQGLDITTDQAVSVWKVFLLENPAYYWLSNSTYVTDEGVHISTVSDYAQYSDRLKYNADVAEMADECGIRIGFGKSQLQTVFAIHDYILGKIDYAYDGDGQPEESIWAHNLIGVASKGAGVCESYAKSFAYLCALNGIENIFVAGSRDSHAWNLVRIDGVWYGADLTRDDGSDTEYLYTGLSRSELNSYTADSSDAYGIDYLYDLPPVSQKRITLVNLYKNGGYVGMFVDADAALEQMNDKTAEYTVECYNYYTGIFITVKHTIGTERLPEISKLIFKGQKRYISDTVYFNSTVFIDSARLNCDLQFEDIDVRLNRLDLNGYTLYLAGDNYITGNNSSAEVYGENSSIINSGSSTLYGNYTVETLQNLRGEIQISASGKIKNLITHNSVRFYGNAENSIVIDNLYCKDSVSSLWIKKQSVTVGNIFKDADVDSYDYITIIVEFIEDEHPRFTVTGDSQVALHLEYFGQRTTISGFDPETGEIHKYYKNPFDVDVPFFNVSQSVYERGVEVYFIKHGKSCNKTRLFYRAENGDLLMREYSTENGFRIFENSVVDYYGSEKSVVLPDGVTAFDYDVFSENEDITSVRICEGVTELGHSSFFYCDSLESVSIPRTVTVIGDYCFYGSDNLKDIYFGGTFEEWKAIKKGYNLKNTGIIIAVHCTDGVTAL